MIQLKLGVKLDLKRGLVTRRERIASLDPPPQVHFLPHRLD